MTHVSTRTNARRPRSAKARNRGPEKERVRGFDLWGFDERDQRDR